MFSLISMLLAALMSGHAQPWNSPHGQDTSKNTLYAAITGSPKTLDPARAYSSDEVQILAQIYEPVMQYHYLKRPYVLIPLTAKTLPRVTYYDAQNHPLADSVNPAQVAYSLYDITIKPGIYYQPSPVFAKTAQGQHLYLRLTPSFLEGVTKLSDFKMTGTRELTADDYVYEIKRLASPQVSSPIFGVMSKHVVGFSEFAAKLKAVAKKIDHHYFDLRRYSISGVRVISRYRYQIKVKGIYPQFKFWLAMTFFAPMPWEADAFFSQPGMEEHNFTLNWYAVGTGPYMLVENNPNKQIVLLQNPHYHEDLYPTSGEPDDLEAGYLEDAGRQMPFVKKVVFSLDKESIPRWNKFLQGYYDNSGVGADSFDQAIHIGKNGKPMLTERMKTQGIRLHTSVAPGVFYIGFNLLDPVVGGYSEKQKKLRRAISIVLNYEEYISIFLNGRGIVAQSPIPPSIFGHEQGEAGVNPYVYQWVSGNAKRRPLSEAKRLLTEAGYPNGINPNTNKPLLLNFDVPTTGSPDDKAYFSWLREQFAKLGIELNIRATLYNRFQDKVREGKVQLYSWGWLADYPDPENFIFLLYGPNAKVTHGGENASNYDNPKVNELYEQIRVLPNNAIRKQKIKELVSLVQEDSPWIWGYYPITFTLSHQWNRVAKHDSMINNSLKYIKIDPKLRYTLQQRWNQPLLWPLAVLVFFLLLIAVPLWWTYSSRERKPGVKRKPEE